MRFIVFLLFCRAVVAADYYVDCVKGHDRAPGTAPAAAWKTLGRVSATTFQPGDRILLRAGCEWTEVLAPQGSGAPGRPITVDRYGDGPKPRIRGNGAMAAVLLNNQEGWEIANLEVTNDAPEEGLRRGVLVLAENAGRALRHIYLRGLEVHHVRGRLGADIVSKTTGGIAFEVRGAERPGRFDDILVEGCSVEHVDNTGIYTWSDYSPHPRDPRWKELRFTGVRLRNNRLRDIGKNAMGVRASLAPLVERNVVENSSARLHGNAIYVFGCKDALIQLNEVYGTKFYGLEGAAFDSDYNSEGTVIQYNYSHDNGGGLVDLCNNPTSRPPRGYNDGTIVRYNVSVDEIERVVGFDGPVTNTKIYNNTIYVGPGLSPRIVEFDRFGKSPGYADGVWFGNNIIHNAGNGTYVYGAAKNYIFEANCFFGNHPDNEPADPKKITADPLLAAPGAAGSGVASVAGYRPTAGSPCARSGVPVEGAGTRDYFGTPLPKGPPDRGAMVRAGAWEGVPLPGDGYDLLTDVVFAMPGGPCRDGQECPSPPVELKADLYLPRRAGPLPAAVYIHGGGWSGGVRTQLWRQAAHMAAKGVAGACISYRLSGQATWPAPLHDSKEAIRWLRANARAYGIDAARIAAVGSSAGGHLAALLGVTGGNPQFEGAGAGRQFSSRVTAVVALNPVLDLEDMPNPAGNIARLLGKGCGEAPGLCREASPISHVSRSAPPFLILHGTADAAVPYRQADEMARRLKQAGVQAELFTARDAPHTFWASREWYEPVLRAIEEFLQKRLTERQQPPR
jgi:acetyl esterase/lipase